MRSSVARPSSYSLADLKRLPSRTQVTRHACEEGWSAIAEWTGVPLRTVLEASGVHPSARFVQFYCYDVVADGIDMLVHGDTTVNRTVIEVVDLNVGVLASKEFKGTLVNISDRYAYQFEQNANGEFVASLYRLTFSRR